MKYLLIVASVLLFSNSAEAHHRHHYRRAPTVVQEQQFNWFQQPTIFDGVRSINVKMHRVRSTSVEVVEHPAGCPRIAYCGCGAAVRVFGKPVRELWLASNWYKFPRTSPMPGAVAVRAHHVFVLESQSSSGNWIVYDANSGSHLTRIHERSLAGYTIVNPRA